MKYINIQIIFDLSLSKNYFYSMIMLYKILFNQYFSKVMIQMQRKGKIQDKCKDNCNFKAKGKGKAHEHFE